MDAIRLLTAPVDPASQSEASSQSTSLVHVPRSALATRSTADGAAYPSDNYVWSVSIEDGGSYSFYAMPRQSNQRSSGSSQWQSQQSSGADWTTPAGREAIAQYAFYAALPAATSGQYLNVYA